MMHVLSGFIQVLENLKSPGILLWHFPELECPGNLLDLSKKKNRNVWQMIRRINILQYWE